MGSKDITEKTLEDYNDVFTDIVNVLLFNGKRLMKEDELVNTKARSQLKIDGKIHEQERDVSKVWLNNQLRIALVGFENQTEYDNTAPMRVMSYDGASYKAQLAEIDRCKRKKVSPPEIVPVVTLVLYFGADSWDKMRLHEVIDIPDCLKDYVSDYKINVFDIKDLSLEQVSMFKSDFRIIADYFYKKYHCKYYVPSDTTIEHVDEFFKLMTALTGDNRFEQAINEMSEEDKKEVRMCEILDKIEARGETRGIEIGEEKLSALLGRLKEAGRDDDFNKAISDKEYRQKLYKEFDM
ncbi:MAG: Rpn family recombination-promoting nuclease/putative transposase [Lachnospiraceae bacterium]|nr:Rpn family recombination-promoting nuclease/putative transposase [Lachnospiraceae bacterium]